MGSIRKYFIVMERFSDDEVELQRHRGSFEDREGAEEWIGRHCGDYYIAEGMSNGY